MDEMRTRTSSVPFFVKNKDDFEQKHPIGKRDRQASQSHSVLLACPCVFAVAAAVGDEEESGRFVLW